MTEEHQEEMVVTEEEQPPKPKKKRRVLVDVRVIEREGEGALVQWMKPDGKNVARGFVDVADIKDGKCDKTALEAAHPFGVPWAKLIDVTKLTPERIEDELHRRQIWTVADIESNTTAADRALLTAAELGIGDLHNRGSEYERSEKDEGG